MDFAASWGTAGIAGRDRRDDRRDGFFREDGDAFQ
jgi:hypothetical protein